MAVTVVEDRRAITGGVDTHAEVHVAAALDPIGGLLGVKEFPARRPVHLDDRHVVCRLDGDQISRAPFHPAPVACTKAGSAGPPRERSGPGESRAALTPP